jgi:site-specific DNA-methyltransferase (adenine-specific)
MREMNGGKQMKSVWTLTALKENEKKFGKHPTQKPVALLERIILASTHERDWIMDPFAGSSTTGVAAIKTQRRLVGIEFDLDFLELSAKRLAQAISMK